MADISATSLTLNDDETISWNNDSSDSRTFDVDQADEKIVVIVDSQASSDTLYGEIEAGDFFQEGYGPIEFEVGTGEENAIIFDSAVVKDEDSEATIGLYDNESRDSKFDTGNDSSTDIYIAVLEL